MTEAPGNSAAVSPPDGGVKLVIHKDGRWFQNGREIVHKEIYRFLNSALEKTPSGEYQVRMGEQICPVEVEDAPFVVLGVTEDRTGDILLELNDGTTEPLSAEGLRIGRDNVPYVHVKDARFTARFSRPAYYQLATYISSEDNETFSLTIKGVEYRIGNHSEGV